MSLVQGETDQAARSAGFHTPAVGSQHCLTSIRVGSRVPGSGSSKEAAKKPRYSTHAGRTMGKMESRGCRLTPNAVVVDATPPRTEWPGRKRRWARPDGSKGGIRSLRLEVDPRRGGGRSRSPRTWRKSQRRQGWFGGEERVGEAVDSRRGGGRSRAPSTRRSRNGGGDPDGSKGGIRSRQLRS